MLLRKSELSGANEANGHGLPMSLDLSGSYNTKALQIA
jgi:hypothetical protein